MRLLDFNEFPVRKKTYGGANGNKLSIIIDNELYMLKLPSHANKNENLSYANSSISEYIGCLIYKSLGIKSQDTLLGTYIHNGTTRICVACKDFEKDGYVLKDFASVKNQIIDSKSNGYGTNIVDILETIEKQTLVDSVELSEYFWDMFVVDAIIGNWDRHNGNWGFLYNQEIDEARIAPIYDCGSCLFPQLDEDKMSKILNDKQLFNARIYDFPTSAILKDGKRINYLSFIKSNEFSQCNKAIERIKEKFIFSEIESIINNIECISKIQKEFFIKIIKARSDAIFQH